MPHTLYTALNRRFGAAPPPTAAATSTRARLDTLRDRLPVDVLQPLPTPPTSPRAKVIVVGAGFAGLSTGYFLAYLGYEVVVYEAGDRLGGRVWTIDELIPGRLVEAGAELIGYNHAVWIGLAQVFGLGFSQVTDDAVFERLGLASPLWLGDRRIEPAEAEWIYEEMERALATLDRPSLDVDPYEPWTSPHAAALDATPLSSWKEQLQLPQLVDEAIEATFADDNVTPTRQQSYLGVLAAINAGGGSAYWDETETLRCESGNDSLARCLAEALQRYPFGEVRLGTRVITLSVNGPRATVTAVAGRTVITDDADVVVLATPPSTWKDMGFYPGAAADIHLGPAVKFLSAVDTRYWLAAGTAPSGMSDVMGEVWESTDNQTCTPSQQVGLSVFAGATSAERALTHPHPEQWYTDHLEKLLPGYAQHYTAQQFMPWPKIPHTLAGYSCPEPGQVTTAQRALSEPFDQRIVFAGEHVCPGFFGYMEGTLESGLLAMGHAAQITGAGFTHAEVVDALRAAAQAGRRQASRGAG